MSCLNKQGPFRNKNLILATTTDALGTFKNKEQFIGTILVVPTVLLKNIAVIGEHQKKIVYKYF
jgi:hypothetical protein